LESNDITNLKAIFETKNLKYLPNQVRVLLNNDMKSSIEVHTIYVPLMSTKFIYFIVYHDHVGSFSDILIHIRNTTYNPQVTKREW
jgi:hypothetical protein